MVILEFEQTLFDQKHHKKFLMKMFLLPGNIWLGEVQMDETYKNWLKKREKKIGDTLIL